jgi:hypothetical protein
MKGFDRMEADGWGEVRCKETTMSRRAEHWVAEQEVALLEAIYQLESPSEPEDRQQPIRLEAQRVRAPKPRLRK